MNQLRLFRILIFAQMALTLLAILASVRLERTLPAPLQAYLAARNDAPFRQSDLVLVVGGLMLMALYVVVWVALLRFWRIGPWLALAVNIGGVVMTLAAGPTVISAIETTLDSANCIIAGVILAMAFFSDVRLKFGIGPESPDPGPG